ncbi:FG-GAP repeat domain-containing protein [Dyadobacter crusticola]|uniref:FG-GAP repeat domain-containing protein n=1 Tax=Dyadobacter crusticola TaxID=292407 RepID=UPI0004E2311F|nr:VCBS repeat-containing protein [Dyadobacter crusticola]
MVTLKHKGILRLLLSRIRVPGLLLFSLTLVLAACESAREKKRVAEGSELAKAYCGNCHQLPVPALLDKATWRNAVLPAMAEKLGIEVLEGNMYLHSKTSTLSSPDWQKILAYYQTLAPDSLTQVAQKQPEMIEKELFSVIMPGEDSATASTMLIRIDSATHSVFSGSAIDPALFLYNAKLGKSLLHNLPSPPVDLSLSAKKGVLTLLTCMGGMSASDETKGQVIMLENDPTSKLHNLSKGLIRPIETRPIDSNRDGLTDYTICAFGHNTGGLYLLKQLSDGSFTTQVIREMPGATCINIRDINADGWPDLVALFAHGDEGIWLFTNDRKGGFIEKNILRFPPVYGSSSFQLVDVNQDGLEDIIYTAGDNSDYSRILKPYHGLYIFTNTGNFTFKQTFFYPVNGCTKATAADFDKDGKVDIATIAFFADLKNKPFEKFLIFTQDKKEGVFSPKRVPIDRLGRWICMDAADWDGDGDTDIVLGNFSRGFLNQDRVQPDWNTRLPFIILENNTVAKSAR